ncbi:hypothetical protein U1872_20430 [Sphingomonas sp. RB3P16]|uniref:hypothetical protein n=1 Tax=Parasphingomonas frigoris TaxID=3096163 RepID=UPI002FCAAA8E
MLFTTPEQVVVLAITLLAGWLLGYASAPNPRKWKRRVLAQSDSFSAYYRDAQDKVRAARQRANDLKAEADAVRADHAEAEQTIAALRATARTRAEPAAAPVRPNDAPVSDDASVVPEAPVAPSAPPQRAWLDASPRDDLTRIRGIDALLAARMFSLGIIRFEDLAKWSDADEMALEHRLGLTVGRMAREQWRDQAALLRAGGDAEHAARFAAADRVD